MIGLTAQQKIDMLRALVARYPVVAHNTLEHVVYTDSCTCGQKVAASFVYDFCPIAGDPEFLRDNNIDVANFDPAISRYVSKPSERRPADCSKIFIHGVDCGCEGTN